MTRIVSIFVFLFCSAGLFAQPTFLKNYSLSKDTINWGFSDIQRLTPNKLFGINLLKNGVGRAQRQCYLLDNQGNITHTQAIPFRTGDDIYSWKYLNSMYVLVSEEIGGTRQYPWHVLQLDTNTSIIKDTRLDSAALGISKEFCIIHGFAPPLKLHNGSIVLSFVMGQYGKPYNKSTVLINSYIMDVNGTILHKYQFPDSLTPNEPLWQDKNGNILWRMYYRPSSNAKPYDIYRISDEQLKNWSPLLNVDLPFFNLPYNNSTFRNYLTTKDGGLVFVYWSEIDFKKYMVKYDSSLKKQWTILVPQGQSLGGSPTDLIMEHSNGTLYFIAQTHADTTISSAFWYCVQDIGLMAISPQGKLQFSAFYGTGECAHFPVSCMEDTDRHIILSGTFNIANAQTCPQECSTGAYAFTMKIDTLGRPYPRRVTSVHDENPPLNFTILTYPNPASDFLTIRLQYSIPSVLCEIFDSKGQRIMSNTYEQTDTIELPIKHIAQGYYICRLTTSHITKSIPFIIQ
ncbi:MAG: T9SS type A sorting domain-containing protein [Ignavibacteria bacterium]|nr:T9SS type A sorting domain-containing protein [Ignavibacteria bacterium]